MPAKADKVLAAPATRGAGTKTNDAGGSSTAGSGGGGGSRPPVTLESLSMQLAGTEEKLTTIFATKLDDAIQTVKTELQTYLDDALATALGPRDTATAKLDSRLTQVEELLEATRRQGRTGRLGTLQAIIPVAKVGLDANGHVDNALVGAYLGSSLRDMGFDATKEGNSWQLQSVYQITLKAPKNLDTMSQTYRDKLISAGTECFKVTFQVAPVQAALKLITASKTEEASQRHGSFSVVLTQQELDNKRALQASPSFQEALRNKSREDRVKWEFEDAKVGKELWTLQRAKRADAARA